MPRTTVRSSLADQAFQGAAEGLEGGVMASRAWTI